VWAAWATPLACAAFCGCSRHNMGACCGAHPAHPCLTQALTSSPHAHTCSHTYHALLGGSTLAHTYLLCYPRGQLTCKHLSLTYTHTHTHTTHARAQAQPRTCRGVVEGSWASGPSCTRGLKEAGVGGTNCRSCSTSGWSACGLGAGWGRGAAARALCGKRSGGGQGVAHAIRRVVGAARQGGPAHKHTASAQEGFTCSLLPRVLLVGRLVGRAGCCCSCCAGSWSHDSPLLLPPAPSSGSACGRGAHWRAPFQPRAHWMRAGFHATRKHTPRRWLS